MLSALPSSFLVLKGLCMITALAHLQYRLFYVQIQLQIIQKWKLYLLDLELLCRTI